MAAQQATAITFQDFDEAAVLPGGSGTTASVVIAFDDDTSSGQVMALIKEAEAAIQKFYASK